MQTSYRACAVLLLSLGALLSACSARNDGSEFVGKWEPASAGKGPVFEITRSGNTFLMTDDSNAKFPGTYDPDKHVLNFSLPLIGQVPFSYDASTHKLLAMGDEFQKAGNGASSGSAESSVGGGAPADKLDREAVTFAKSLAAPYLIVCDGRTYARLTHGRLVAEPWLAELKNPTFSADSDDVSEANRLNGIDWRGSIDLKWDAYRAFDGGKWTEWMDARTDGLTGGREPVYVRHTKGRWEHYDEDLGMRDFARMRRKPISCDTIPKG